MFKDYDAEQVMLPDDLKKKREDELYNKEKELRDLQRKRFGFEGDLFKKKQELIKPIQDKIYNAVKKLAQDGSYAVIFDKSSDLVMLYTNPKYDKSDDILLALGYKPGKKDAGGSGGSDKGGSGKTSSGDKPTLNNERDQVEPKK
jgi:outer membrane protein